MGTKKEINQPDQNTRDLIDIYRNLFLKNKNGVIIDKVDTQYNVDFYENIISSEVLCKSDCIVMSSSASDNDDITYFAYTALRNDNNKTDIDPIILGYNEKTGSFREYLKIFHGKFTGRTEDKHFIESITQNRVKYQSTYYVFGQIYTFDYAPIRFKNTMEFCINKYRNTVLKNQSFY